MHAASTPGPPRRCQPNSRSAQSGHKVVGSGGTVVSQVDPPAIDRAEPPTSALDADKILNNQVCGFRQAVLPRGLGKDGAASRPGDH